MTRGSQIFTNSKLLIFTSLIYLCAVVSCKHESVLKTTDVIGQTQEETTKKFGKPASEGEFVLSKSWDEMRIELHNKFPKDSWDKVTIREQTWNFSKGHMTLWFYQTNGTWKVIDGVRYDKNVQF